MTAATMKITSTLPAAFASSHTARIASGSSTSWTQRATTIRGGMLGRPSGVSSASSCSSAVGGAASGACSETPLTCIPPLPEYG